MTSLYLHIPFCRKKCLYCSFCVYVGQLKHADRYVLCLAKESCGRDIGRVATVYAGGGTPSLFTDSHCGALAEAVLNNFDLTECREFSFEINPEDVTPAKAKHWREMGVNRASLGVQTFSDVLLKKLGRGHDRGQAVRAYDILREAGFDNISLDLMTGLPGQGPEVTAKDISVIKRLACDHVSVYCLSVEPRSHYFVQKVALAQEDVQAEQYSQVCGLLEEAGYAQYEISNFSRPGKQSLHNINYWRGGNYWGLGVAAHSHFDGRRSWNTDRLKDYLRLIEASGSAKAGEEILTPEKRLTEALLFGLRMNEGVDVAACEKRFGTGLSRDRKERIGQFVGQGWLEEEAGRLKATASGRLILDELAGYLV